MKKIILAGLVVLFTSFSGAAFAANTEGTKVGVVNFQEVLQKSSEFEALKSKLDKQFSPKQKKVLDAQKELQKEVDEFRRNDSVMKEEDKKKLQEKIIKKQQEIQSMEIGFQKEYVEARDKLFQELFNALKGKIAKIAQDEKLDLVLTSEAVAFSKAPDITQKVIDALKK